MEITGIVVKGDQNGRKIGFPTANLDVQDKLNLEPGVYKAKCEIENKEEFNSLVFFGSQKIKEKKDNILEVYILNFDKEIYGQTLHLSQFRFIRNQITFSSLEELKTQLEKDLKQVSN